MDWVALQENCRSMFKKYRYVVLVVLAGLFLMMLPEEREIGKETQIQEIPQQKQDLAQSLEEILSLIQGAGKVKVLLTEAYGEEVLYQTDEDQTQGETSRDRRWETVLITDENRSQTGLVRQVIPPGYQGAVVLCQGADNSAVRLAVCEAVSNATGLTFDKISVLKMK